MLESLFRMVYGITSTHGEMAERFNVPPWKGGVLERVPGVRISLSPQNKERLRDFILREWRSKEPKGDYALPPQNQTHKL